jgi:hypothetical protein
MKIFPISFKKSLLILAAGVLTSVAGGIIQDSVRTEFPPSWKDSCSFREGIVSCGKDYSESLTSDPIVLKALGSGQTRVSCLGWKSNSWIDHDTMVRCTPSSQ